MQIYKLIVQHKTVGHITDSTVISTVYQWF